MAKNSDVVLNVDGLYIRASEQSAHFVTAFAEGASRAQFIKYVRDRYGKSINDEDALKIVESIAAQLGLSLKITISQAGQETISGKRNESVKYTAPSLKSSIRCKATILTPRATNAIARPLSAVFSPLWSLACIAGICIVSTIYINKYGLSSLWLSSAIKTQSQLSAQSALYLLAFMFFSYLAHELGHSAAGVRFGNKSGRIGFGFYWLFPVFFSDVTSSWRLTQLRRVVVDSAGIFFQLIASTALMLIVFSSTSIDLENAAKLSIAMDVFTILGDLNPILKFDGYWIFSDAFDIPNLSAASNCFLQDFIHLTIHRRYREVFGLIRSNYPLAIYAVFSILYSFLFIAFISYAVAVSWRYMVNGPKHFFEIIINSHNPRSLEAILNALITLLGQAVPLILMPFVVISTSSRLMKAIILIRQKNRSIHSPDSH